MGYGVEISRLSMVAILVLLPMRGVGAGLDDFRLSAKFTESIVVVFLDQEIQLPRLS